MHAHTWEDPEIYLMWTVNQANQNDWPRETWKKWASEWFPDLAVMNKTATGIVMCLF